MNFYDATADWGLFSEVEVSDIDNTVTLTVDTGRGVATGSVSGAGGDRRIYVLDDFLAEDMEVRLDWELTAGASQAGIALRVQDGQAVVVWNNITFGATGNLLQGVWEYDGDDLLDTNQDGSLNGFTIPVLSASGDGSAVTVRTTSPHHMAASGLIVHFDASFGGHGQETVTAVPDATSFRFADAASGPWTGGTVRRVTNVGRRKAAARLVDDRIVFKQWLPGEPEPSWADPLRASSVLLPDELNASGGPPPTGLGGAGIVVAHLGSTGAVRVNDFTVQAL